MYSEYKTVKVSLMHYEELSKLGEVKDSFDKVIGRLLEGRKNTTSGGRSD
jgi:predicted CopG family antitoxin